MGISLASGKRRRNIPLSEQFARFASPEPNSGCHLWLGTVTKGGYGILRVARRTRPATHIALELDGRARPAVEQLACHTCDNPSCVNPVHLFWADHAGNMADQKAKRRHWATRAAGCANGHAWSTENTRIGQDGRKNCRACERDRLARRKAKRTARLAETE